VSDLVSVELERVPNVKHMLKSAVEFKPCRPAGIVPKYLGNAVLFPQMLPSFNTEKSEFSILKCCWRSVGHFLLGGRLDLLKMGGERVSLCVFRRCSGLDSAKSTGSLCLGDSAESGKPAASELRVHV